MKLMKILLPICVILWLCWMQYVCNVQFSTSEKSEDSIKMLSKTYPSITNECYIDDSKTTDYDTVGVGCGF